MHVSEAFIFWPLKRRLQKTSASYYFSFPTHFLKQIECAKLRTLCGL